MGRKEVQAHPKDLISFSDVNDVMVPPEEAEIRQTSVQYHGSTALALTLTGASALDAPYALQKCGIFWGTFSFW